MEKYGFVYIWYDCKHKRYYVGCHWGTEEDGYICSSTNMNHAYKRRPNDFKRRILSRVSDRSKLLEEEYKWLSQIKQEELRVRYYNLHNHHFNHWSHDNNLKISIGQKISLSQRSNPNFGKWNKGNVVSEETKRKISQSTSIAMKEHYKKNPRSEETRKKISENNKRLQKEKLVGMHGKKHSEETIQKMKINNAMNNPEHVAKIKVAKQGIRWMKNGEIKKMAVPGTDKYNMLINQGFQVL